MNMEKKRYPHVRTHLFKDYVAVPEVIRKSSGILINGKRFKALLFTTDIALIMNNDADAIMAVYPFTPHPAIIRAITSVSTISIMAGIAGGTTQGIRSANMALFAESHGCKAVVINAPTPTETIKRINEVIDIPIILTVVSEYTEIEEKINAGVDIINISGAGKTSKIVRQMREKYPDLPIIATGGPTDESILETIEAGANAITYTPPSNGELFSKKMMDYREREKDRFEEE
ncbi:MAG: hydrolase [Alkalibacterium sp.]|nr:hydrolase [Alkalibacterium sp.]TVP91186.1 MAG: hydrolase [Alkalibacterium sp.]